MEFFFEAQRWCSKSFPSIIHHLLRRVILITIDTFTKMTSLVQYQAHRIERIHEIIARLASTFFFSHLLLFYFILVKVRSK
jgi:glutamate-1-semialdehyde aminotransferase